MKPYNPWNTLIIWLGINLAILGNLLAACSHSQRPPLGVSPATEQCKAAGKEPC